MRKINRVMIVIGALVLSFALLPGAWAKELSLRYKKDISDYNEWGKLREVIVGTTDDLVIPDYIPSLQWMTAWGKEDYKKYAGKNNADVVPEQVKAVKEQVDQLVKVLEERGVKVHRNIPLRYPEEKKFLDEIQRGCYLLGGADFVRVIGNNALIITNFRDPFRRKQVYSVRPVLEAILKNSNARYVAMPPVSPHCSEDDIYLENGDIMVDGHNVYVGISGNASSEEGAEWLQQFLGPEYRVYTIKLDPSVLHLDCVLSLNRPGLLTYYPELVSELPRPLKHWDKIEVYKEKGEEEAFGANNLSLDENTIIVPEQYKRVADEYRKRGMEVILLPLDMTIEYGSGPRCLTGVVKRDP